MRSIILAILLSSAGSAAADCINRTVVDRISNPDGQEFITQQNRSVCGDRPNEYYEKIVPGRANCRDLWIDGVKTLECRDSTNAYKQIDDVIGIKSKMPISTQPDIKRDYSHNNSYIGVAINIYKKWTHSLPDEIATLHNNAVKIALEQGQNGDIIEWSDPRTRANGNIRVATTSVKSGLICRTLLININYKISRSSQETACLNADNTQWSYLE